MVEGDAASEKGDAAARRQKGKTKLFTMFGGLSRRSSDKEEAEGASADDESDTALFGRANRLSNHEVVSFFERVGRSRETPNAHTHTLACTSHYTRAAHAPPMRTHTR